MGQHVVDVSRARALVFKSGRLPHLAEKEAIERLLEGGGPLIKEHIFHVDPSEPGIIGQLYGGMFLLDGRYRAARCVQEKMPFYAWLLTFDETIDCLVNEPQVTPERAIQEIREMLRNNPGQIDADLNLTGALKGANSPRIMESIIRSMLTWEENARLRLVFHHEGRIILARLDE